jgi:integrase
MTMPAPDDDAREAMRATLLAAGHDPATVNRMLSDPADEPEVLRMRGAVDLAMQAMRADRPDSVKTWGPYLAVLVDGLPLVCPCPCPVCAVGPCPCAPGADGHDGSCQMPADNAHTDCGARYAGIPTTPVQQVLPRHVSDAAWWAERRGLQRAVARNVARAAAGRTLDTGDGRGAKEQLIQASRWMFTWLLDQELATKNPAAKVKLPPRQVATARSLDPDEFVEVFGVAITTGQDPALDGLILRHLLIQGVRRGGLLQLSCGGLLVDELLLKYYDKKKKQWRTRPTTRAHMADLLAHAIARGPRQPAPPGANETERRTGVPALTATSPVFYAKPTDTFDENGFFVSRVAHPITRKRPESLFKRIRRHLPWTERRELRPHDIRHTSGRMIYKAADDQMAKLHLAHDGGSTTDHYIREHLEELAKLKELLFAPPNVQTLSPDR